MPPPSIENDEFQIFRMPLLRLLPAYQSSFHPFHSSLGLFSTSCGSLKAVTKFLFARRNTSPLITGAMIEWASGKHPLRVKRNVILLSCQVWTAASYRHTVHHILPLWHFADATYGYRMLFFWETTWLLVVESSSVAKSNRNVPSFFR